MSKTILALVAPLILAASAFAQEQGSAARGAAAASAEDLAKQLANPVAALISVPFQLNYDQDIGPVREGDRWTLNIQPVIPMTLNSEWNVISRTILPVVSQDDIFPGAGSQSGLGDVVQSLFFRRSPRPPTAGSGARAHGRGAQAARSVDIRRARNHIWSLREATDTPMSAPRSCSPS